MPAQQLRVEHVVLSHWVVNHVEQNNSLDKINKAKNIKVKRK